MPLYTGVSVRAGSTPDELEMRRTSRGCRSIPNSSHGAHLVGRSDPVCGARRDPTRTKLATDQLDSLVAGKSRAGVLDFCWEKALKCKSRPSTSTSRQVAAPSQAPGAKEGHGGHVLASPDTTYVLPVPICSHLPRIMFLSAIFGALSFKVATVRASATLFYWYSTP